MAAGPMTVPIPRDEIDVGLMASFPREFLEENAVVPLFMRDGVMKIYGRRESYGAALEMGMLRECEVDFVDADPSEIRKLVTEWHGRGSSRQEAMAEHDGGTAGSDEDLADDSPVARIVDDVLRKAVQKRASDIHIEPGERETSVRVRVDGVLVELERLQRVLHPVVVSRIKIMARLKIEERRLPQDGRIPRTVEGREIDLRVSTIPTGLGERVVLRILDRAAVRLTMEDLGMDPGLFARWKRAVEAPNGIILVTGPTGSGKTTTLYTVLEKFNTGRKNILTVEDPVEYQIEGIGQMQVNPRIDLTFASGLRSMLRQDPDIIMVGEIRDEETARIAVQASLTGHLVLSTLHTNDAFSAPQRLEDMGVEPYLLGSTLRAVLSQRLVRRLCSHCKAPAPIDDGLAGEQARLALGIESGTPIYRATGCDACEGMGFRGRVGIFELMPVEGAVRELVLGGEPAPRIAEAAIAMGCPTLRSSGRLRVISGETTPEEVIGAAE